MKQHKQKQRGLVEFSYRAQRRAAFQRSGVSAAFSGISREQYELAVQITFLADEFKVVVHKSTGLYRYYRPAAASAIFLYLCLKTLF